MSKKSNLTPGAQIQNVLASFSPEERQAFMAAAMAQLQADQGAPDPSKVSAANGRKAELDAALAAWQPAYEAHLAAKKAAGERGLSDEEKASRQAAERRLKKARREVEPRYVKALCAWNRWELPVGLTLTYPDGSTVEMAYEHRISDSHKLLAYCGGKVKRPGDETGLYLGCNLTRKIGE